MPLEDDLPYACPSCGEDNHVGVDPTAGGRQTLIEDCPVCCRPLRFVIRVRGDGPSLEEVRREE